MLLVLALPASSGNLTLVVTACNALHGSRQAGQRRVGSRTTWVEGGSILGYYEVGEVWVGLS